MARDYPLPGLERLMDVCRRSGIPSELDRPSIHPLEAGEMAGGLPFDPLLAAVYARSRRMAFGGELEGFYLHSADDVNELVERNKEERQGWPEIFRSSLFVFAGEPALLYCYATVPGLANETGVQPVVMVDPYEDVYALPIASSVDRFFDTYSRALERWVELLREDAESKARFEAEFGPPAPDSLAALMAEKSPTLNFPWEVPDLIARDEPLVKLLQAGRFDFLMESCPDALAWVAKVLDASTRT